MKCPVCRTELQPSGIGEYCPNSDCKVTDDWHNYQCGDCGMGMMKTVYGAICPHCNKKKHHSDWTW